MDGLTILVSSFYVALAAKNKQEIDETCLQFTDVFINLFPIFGQSILNILEVDDHLNTLMLMFVWIAHHFLVPGEQKERFIYFTYAMYAICQEY